MNKYQVDTKGICFLCLNNGGSRGRGNGGNTNDTSNTQSFIELSRFLKFNYAKVFNLQVPPEQGNSSNGVLEETEMIVNLCHSCSAILNNFKEMYKTLEEIRLRLSVCVDNIRYIMKNAEDDRGRLENYRGQLMATNYPLELMNANIANNLREEIIKKCTAHTNNYLLKTSENISKDPKHQPQPGPQKDQQNMNNNTAADDVNAFVDENNDPFVLDIVAPSILFVERIPEASSPSLPSQPPPPYQTQQREYPCEFCSQTFQTDRDHGVHTLSNHLSIIFPPVWYPNSTPEEVEAAFIRLLKKSEFHSTENGNISCVYCGEAYNHSKLLQLHLITKHNDELRQELSRELESSFSSSSPQTPLLLDNETPSSSPIVGNEFCASPQCPTCGKTFSSTSNLNQHLRRVHSEKTPYKCSYCPRGFTNNTELRFHTVTFHLGDIFKNCKDDRLPAKRFKAIVTSFIEKTVRMLRKDNVFVCNFCGKSCKTKSHSKFHLVTSHHQEVVVKLKQELPKINQINCKSKSIMQNKSPAGTAILSVTIHPELIILDD